MGLLDDASDLAHNVASYGGRDGERWLEQLEQRVAELAERWGLTDLQPFADLSMNFVASANRRGVPVALKLGWERGSVSRERIWLEHYNRSTHDAVISVLAHDGDAYLMPRLEPGTSVDQVLPDEAATEVIGQAIASLSQASHGMASDPGYRTVGDWFTQLERASTAARDGLGARIARANDLSHELSQGAEAELLHGDLHHMNVLSHAGRWLITDPQGVFGDPAHECAAMLRNALALIRDDVPAGVRRRVALLAEVTGFEAERIAAWGVAQNVLSCVWSLDSDPNADVAAVLAVVDALA